MKTSFNFAKSVAGMAFAVAAFFPSVDICAANPFLPLWEYIPDGEPYVFEDPDNPGKYRVYIYGSHDSRKTDYCGLEQVVWSAPVDSLSAWRYDGVIFESKLNADGKPLNEGGRGDVLFAPDVAEVTAPDGTKTYYLYPNNQAGGRNGMIAKSSRPDGPFTVSNWSKENPNTTDGVFRFDPGVLVDDDGRVYGYWGFERSYAAEIDPLTMATVKPGCEIVEDMIPSREGDTVFRFFEASSMRKIKDKYVFVYSRWSNDGDFGMPASNYTLAYAYSDNPLGPFTYGGTIIDGRARDTDADGKIIPTATPYGNTHGSIIEINGKWYVFYHRQCGTNEYARQAMVAPIEVSVEEGKGGKVFISEAEYTSEGFETAGLDPMKRYSAGIACYYTGLGKVGHSYPDFLFTGSYVKPYYGDADRFKKPYDLSENLAPVVNNTAGSIVGYKYFNFENTPVSDLMLDIMPLGHDATVTVMLDSPWESKGGKKIGSLTLSKDMAQERADRDIPLTGMTAVKGKHAVYFVIDSDEKAVPLFDIYELQFK
ncbi:MAG: family 43 glycosylhydrolase [Muribaculum sp.]|nr:family 43 glycosylhydrolase [Muribaculum sp.]MDE6458203.1 family 43 glycosylhydrolase [Muribaculum sp.]